MRDKILAMEAGRELDALVAEKVMNLCVLDNVQMYGDGCVMSDKGFDEWMKHSEYRKTEDPDILPPYSSDISAAWEVVEKMNGIYAFEVGRAGDRFERKWTARFGMMNEWVEAYTAPEAICKASLLAVIKS